jgi:predicted DNA-binding protein with PD1-like motif
MKIHTFRLKPDQDLKSGVEQYVNQNNIKAGFVITCVAGVKQATLRMAGAEPDNQDIRVFEGPLEVDSMVGTVSTNGCHLHVTVSNKEGQVFGGHLKENSPVYPTAEIVIGEDTERVYTREMDEETGFKELVVKE